MNKRIFVPNCFLASPSEDDDVAARKRRELREKLLRGDEVVVTQDGEVEDKNKKKDDKPAIVVPEGKLAIPGNDDDAAAQERKKLREKLLSGQEVIVTQQGEVEDKKDKKDKQPAIVVPEGKLASSFYWYERDPDLLAAEKESMNHFFPLFKMEKLSDSRLSWVGTIKPKNVRKNAIWYIQAIYDHNHPHNSSYGGSIKVYSIEPDLEKISPEIGFIPHTLRDSANHIYICTARPEDVKVGEISTSAASAVSWTAKWISAFELWLAGDITTNEFSGHNI